MKKDPKIPNKVWKELEKMQSEFNGNDCHKMVITTISVPIEIEMGIDIDKKNRAHCYDVYIKPNHPQIKLEVQKVQQGINQYLKKCREVSKKYNVEFDPWWLHL